ncbi:MAG: PAS domain S-box protein [Dehalococcoidales bacterium]|nr:PAS domain S-box protein [Dehalococcoidales bacterium]
MSEAENYLDYRNLFELMDHGVIYQSPEGTILAMNSSAERILNISREQLVNSEDVNQHLHMVHEDLSNYPAEEHPTMRAVRSGESVRNEIMGYWHESEQDYRWVTVSAIPEFRAGETKPYRVFVTFTDITQQKRAEDLLQKNEERYQQLYEHMRSSLVVYEPVDNGEDFVFREINEVTEKVEGISRDEVIGRKVTEVFPGIVDFGLLEVFKRVWQTGVPEHHPVSQYQDDRITGWRDNYVYKLPSGEIVAIYDDVTENKKIEEALHESERNFRNSLDDSPLGIRIVTESGETTYINRTMLDMYGYETLEQFERYSVEDRYTEESYKEYLERKEKRKKGEYISPHYTVSIRRKDGEIRHLEVFRKEVRWNGQSQFQVVCNDITQRIRNEEELQLRSILLDRANDGVCLFNGDGDYLYVNDGFCRMHGLTKDEVIGKNIRDVVTSTTESFLTNLENEMGKSGFALFESTHFNRDGAPFYLEVHSTEIHVADKRYNLSIERNITERKKMEEALFESEKNFRNLIDESPLGIVIKKDAGTLVYVNQAGLDLYGFNSLEEMKNTPMFELQLPEIVQRSFDRWDRIYNGEFTGERDNYPVIRKDGEVRFIEVYINKILWDGTEHIQFLFHDVTERQRLDMERLALNGASRSVLTSTDFLSAAREIFDYCREVTGAASGYIALLNEETNENDVLFLEAGGMPCSVDPSLPMPVRGLRAEAYKQKKSVFENRFPETDWEKLLPEGHVTLRNVLFSPLVVDDKAVGVIGLANKQSDFTDTDIRIINSLAEICSIALINSRYLELMQANEEKYRLLFESISDGFTIQEAIFDENDNVVDCIFLEVNPAFEKQSGLSRQEVIGKKLSEITFEESIDLSFWFEQYEEVVKTGEPQRFDTFSEYLRKWYSMLVFRNKPGQFATIFQDITEKRQIETERERAVRLESVGTLAGGIAHDFNNILTGVLGNISLAKMDMDPESETYEILNEAEEASLRARDLTYQLLTFARGGEPVKKVTRINRLIRSAAAFGSRGSRTKPDFSIQEDLWAVEVDEGQINQAILNIVNNAVEAMPGGGKLKITAVNETVTGGVSVPLEPGEYVKIIIEDKGIGITPDHLTRIFEPYFTTKQKGSGLGLATTYSIIRNHRGTITCDSTQGEGTTFRIYLPALPEVSVTAKEGTEEIIKQGHGRILVMDDEDIIRILLKRLLTDAGYEVELTKNGREAIESYTDAKESGNPFSAVILDLTVPGGMGGEATVAKLREIDPGVKAIVSSGYSTNAAMANYKNHGFDGVVAKPYNITQVLNTLAEVLGEG